MIDQCMYAERERKSNFITIFFLPVGSIRRPTTSWPGVVDSTAIAAATAFAW